MTAIDPSLDAPQGGQNACTLDVPLDRPARSEERSGESPYLPGVATPRLTGERPTPGATPDSLLALHAAGYREVGLRLGRGRVLDAGCGLGFESVSFAGEGRRVVGVDYDPGAAAQAQHRWEGAGLTAACMDAARLGLSEGSIDWACSSHLIEHFDRPETHVSEIARVLAPSGTAFFLCPNAPADFENPFHVVAFEAADLAGLLGQFFESVWVGGLDGNPAVKQDIGRRRVKARRVLALDVLGLRRRLPRSWYISAYTKVLPLAYRLIARGDAGGATGISDNDFFVTDQVDSTTLVLFAIVSNPRRMGR